MHFFDVGNWAVGSQASTLQLTSCQRKEERRKELQSPKETLRVREKACL